MAISELEEWAIRAYAVMVITMETTTDARAADGLAKTLAKAPKNIEISGLQTALLAVRKQL